MPIIEIIASHVRTMRAVMNDPLYTEAQRAAKMRRLVLRLESELFFAAATEAC